MYQYTRPPVTDYQKDFINDNSKIVVVEASTKAGKTVGEIIWLFEQALQCKPEQHCWWIAPTYSQSKIAFRRMKRYIQPQELYKHNDSELTITLINKVIISFKTAEKPDNLYGEDVMAVVIDEFTRAREEVQDAVESITTATNGKIRYIGNVTDNKNWGWHFARIAETSDKIGYYKVTIDDAIKAEIVTREQINDIEERFAKMGRLNEYNALYNCIPNTSSRSNFASAFDKELHTEDLEWNSQPVYMCFDFNIDPMTCTYIQHYPPINGQQGFINVVDEYQESEMVLKQFAKNAFKRIPKNLQNRVYITGDPAGNTRSMSNQSLMTMYDMIGQALELPNSVFVFPIAHLTHTAYRVLLNTILAEERFGFKINKTCQQSIFELENVIFEGTRMKKTNRSDKSQRADAIDTILYFIQGEYKQYLE